MYFPSAIHHPVRQLGDVTPPTTMTAQADPDAVEALLDYAASISARAFDLAKEPFIGSDLRTKLSALRADADDISTRANSPETHAADGSFLPGLFASYTLGLKNLEARLNGYASDARRNAILAGIGITTIAAFGTYFIWKKT